MINEPLMELSHTGNRHPRTKGLSLDYLAGQRASGGTLAATFSSAGTYSEVGSRGLMEHRRQPSGEAPKYQAVITFPVANPKWR